MSADTEGDFASLCKDEDTSTADIQPDVSNNSSEIDSATSSLSKVDSDQNTLTFMGVELEPFDNNEEAIIQKKVNPLEKDKALDIDSELDFELKWDDDLDNANDESKAKTDAEVDFKLKWDDEIDNAVESQSKTKTDATIIDKRSDKTPNQEQETTEQETVNKPEIIGKQVDFIDQADDEKDVGLDNNTARPDPEVTKSIDAASSIENSVFIMDTDMKLGLGGKGSSEDSESSSLDGRLVYSDVDVPEIEDKELLDEIDAQICEADNNSKEREMEEETPVIESEKGLKESNDPVSTEPSMDSAMDVDEETILESAKTVNETNSDDTLSTSNELETSSYELNKQHGLANPDVMIEIPTQELIETFDNSGDMSDEALQYDEDLLLSNDETNADRDIEGKGSPNERENEKVIDEKANTNKINGNEDITEICKNTNEQANANLQLDNAELETKTSEFIEKPTVETENVNIETNVSKENEVESMDIDVQIGESHADIILEASHTEPKLIAEAQDISHLGVVEPTPVTEIEHVNSPDNLGTKVDTDLTKNTSTDDVELKVVTEVKENISQAQIESQGITEDEESHDATRKVDTEVNESTSKAEIESQVITEVNKFCDATPQVATEVKEDTSTAEIASKVMTEVKKTHDVTPKVLTATAETDSQMITEVKEGTSKTEIASEVITEVMKTHDVTPKVVTEVKKGTSTAEIESQVIPEAKECTFTTEIASEMTTEVIKSHDVTPKVVIEVKEGTSTAETESQMITEVKEGTSKTEIASEVIKTHDETPKVVTEVKECTSTAEIEAQVITEVKEGTSTTEIASEMTTEVMKTRDVPPKVVTEVKEVTTTAEIHAQVTTEVKEGTSTTAIQPDVITQAKEGTSIDAAQPSTSKYMRQESSDEDQEVTDSLGLLAESSRVMDDDDEPEPDDDDEDDDFDQDDESNQMTAEHSEDSNAQHSETDVAREAMDVDESNDGQDKTEFPFQIAEVLSTTDIEVSSESEAKDGMEVSDESEVEKAVQALLGVQDSKNEEEKADNVAEAAEGVAEGTVQQSEEGPDDGETEDAASKLRQLLIKDKEPADTLEAEKTSPSKAKKLEISKPKNEINIVDLEESSSEDDIQEVLKKPATPEPGAEKDDVTTVNIPDEVEVMSTSAGNTSEMRHGEGEVVIKGVPKPPPHKPARLNTSEVTIKTAVATTESLVIPEAKTPIKSSQDKKQPKLGLEIFSLDSDDESNDAPKPLTAVEIDKARATNKCINVQCSSAAGTPSGPAGPAAVAYYGGRTGAVCRVCDIAVTSRTLSLIEGIRDLTPLLSLDMGQTREELVEISDSDSEEDACVAKEAADTIEEREAAFMEEELASMFNKTWKKFNMDARLLAAETEINSEVQRLEEECSNINTMLNECQVATDKLRNNLYDSFAGERKELPAILIYDTPPNTWSGLEEGILEYETAKEHQTRQSKRRSSIPEPPAKRAAIPLGYTPLESDSNTANEPKASPPSATEVAIQNDDDNSDISVVKLSAEAAPAGLPPPGTATRPPLRPQMTVYAMRNAFGSWSRARIIDVQPKVNNQFTMCRVKFEHKVKNPCKLLQARCLAYEHPSDVRMTIGTRLIALFKDNDNKRESYYSGIVAEIPNPVNNYRYLVFFDDGYAQYVQHAATRLVCECAPLVWDEVHPFSRQFVREYLRSYPERPMVRVHAGQSIKTEYNGKWWVSRVMQVDASLVRVHFEEEDRMEWIYRGSTRLAPLYLELQAAERQRARPLPRAQPGRKFNMPYVEYTRSDEPLPPAPTPTPTPAQIEQDIRRQRAVAKKSTAQPAPPPAPAPLDGVTSRVVFYTPKNAIKPHKMVPHTCGPRCRRTDVLALKDLRTYNPLTKPLLSGWERQIVKYRWTRSVMYRAPCGRRLRNYAELHRYLQVTGSDMGVDLFDFGPNTHCLAEFVLNKCLISKKDLSHGKENVPVPCVNYYDESLPEFCSYNTERTPTAGVPLNLDPEFLCGCDCTDDCADKSKCACWKMTLEGARTIGLDCGSVGYVYKRLPEPLPSGIYECNSRCKCRQTCLNRVAQHPLQLKLQVFKTLNRGWGIRALNDIPKGAFLCVYAGNLLTDATANLDGLNEGDEYLAELDYIEVVEQMKEGFEEDIPEADKRLDKKEGGDQADSSSSSSSEEEEDPRKDEDDDDFRPAAPLSHAPSEFSKRLRKREKSKKKGDAKEDKPKDKDPNAEDNCITISDDEELREPARFAAQAGMGDKGFISKYKSLRAHFGKDEACYIMDAKVQGNIGRYLNHSCTPNVFVQNVFVDTHDPRFPWVAFFALAHIRAGTELTWNYNYDVGSVPGKVLYCHCAAPNCRGRLL